MLHENMDTYQFIEISFIKLSVNENYSTNVIYFLLLITS